VAGHVSTSGASTVACGDLVGHRDDGGHPVGDQAGRDRGRQVGADRAGLAGVQHDDGYARFREQPGDVLRGHSPRAALRPFEIQRALISGTQAAQYSVAIEVHDMERPAEAGRLVQRRGQRLQCRGPQDGQLHRTANSAQPVEQRTGDHRTSA
jgi:hypothetical protein